MPRVRPWKIDIRDRNLKASSMRTLERKADDPAELERKRLVQGQGQKSSRKLSEKVCRAEPRAKAAIESKLERKSISTRE